MSLPYYMQDYPIHGRLREQAPGLTLDAVDSLLRDAWVAGFSAGVEDIGPQVKDAEDRTASARAAIKRVIGGQLIHVSLGLRRDRRKATIAVEREWMERQATALDKAIADLEAI